MRQDAKKTKPKIRGVQPPKLKVGRPFVNATPVMVRLYKTQVQKLDAFVKEKMPGESRAAAIRELIERCLRRY